VAAPIQWQDQQMDSAERWTSTVVLGDGSSALIRPIVPGDATALAEFHGRQSPDSRYLRFFSPKPELNESELERFTTVDFIDRVAFVVEIHGEFQAWASYERWNNRDDAEVAFMVDDHHQGLGIATLLLEHLAAVARSNAIGRFTAQTLGDNRGMLAVFAKAGWPVQRRFESGVIDIEFSLDDTSNFVDSVERREQRADSRAMARVLLPTSIAVIGASDQPNTVGQALWRAASSSSAREVYPVNPKHASVGGVGAYRRVTDIEGDVALALVAVPAPALEATIQECIDKRVRGAVVVTALGLDRARSRRSPGSPERGSVDADQLVAHARSHGLRIIGPGSMGIASPRADVDLQAALVDVDLPPGNVAISMQSGTLGGALLRLASQLQLPTSWFVSLGDKADVSGNDLLQFWEDDEATHVIAIYTESFGNPRKFARIARRVSRRRPIVAVRTGAALLGPGPDALYRDAGVIEVPTVTALLDTARVLATQPMIKGRRVAVVSNSRSPTVLAEATLRAADLDVVDAPRRLDWTSTPDEYAKAVRAALDSADIDAVMVVHAPPLLGAVGAPDAAIDRACKGATKPVLAVMLGAGDGPLLAGSSVPSFAFPEQAAAVLGRIAVHAEWRQTELADADADRIQAPDHIDVTAAGAAIDRLMGAEGAAVVAPVETAQLLATYGIPTANTRVVASAGAADAADAIGYPVAIKARHRRVGRSVEAGVALDLADRVGVEQAIEQMSFHLGADADHVIVQEMAAAGIDIRVRVRSDDRLGPVITVGLGGLHADAIGDEASRLAPVSHSVALAMIDATRAATTLSPEAAERLADVVVRAAQLASDHPAIVTLDLNPVIVNDHSCRVVDAELQLARPSRPEPAVRRLE
jgi:acyl-CoA synthetase (NDP forming)/GNAT superfamily N-acetyltransferase